MVGSDPDSKPVISNIDGLQRKFRYALRHNTERSQNAIKLKEVRLIVLSNNPLGHFIAHFSAGVILSSHSTYPSQCYSIGAQDALSVAATKEHEIAPQPQQPRFIKYE